MKITLDKIKLIHVIGLALFEASTLFFISFFNLNMKINSQILSNMLGGLLVGFLGVLPIIFLFNIFLKFLNIKIKNEKLAKISYLVPSIYLALFLFLLFFIESIVSPVKRFDTFLNLSLNHFQNVVLLPFILLAGNFIVALITTPVCLGISLLLYNKFKLKIKLNKSLIIQSTSILPFMLISAIYEASFLPLLSLFDYYLILSTNSLLFSLTGFILSLFSGFITMFIYNLFLRKNIYINC